MITTKITTPANHTMNKLHSPVYALTCSGDVVEHRFEECWMEFTSQYLNDNVKRFTNHAVVFVSSLYKTDDDSPYENYNGTYSLYTVSQLLFCTTYLRRQLHGAKSFGIIIQVLAIEVHWYIDRFSMSPPSYKEFISGLMDITQEFSEFCYLIHDI